ncbi:multidrug ABC transporter ATPase [Paenibacillus terrae HPL-003]|uniref:Multidrug ABC transporter ATPase n=1 Tax=Paenibacillus terrae (strain HPL-003) TaxID=985665 RepID=G7W050_PAETH|nr:ABC transporter ATP-binding protein [Paenibacillus sp. 23TSA30-6]AET58606.1 multidrug ABC transporter ATPase [Paenibacillus terrae HPL-003]MBE0337248.1 ABC transporter ATP-binding protein [Paenibacillus sp. 23TSA30-6]
MTIDIRGLCKSYGSHQVLNELHFHIDNGIFGLLGDNGAGKTTLMKILATLLGFDRGEVEIFGHSLKKEPDAIRSLLGYLPQHFDFFPNVTIMESMNYFAALKGIQGKRHIQEETSQRLIEVGLIDQVHKKIKQLSGGMKQRLGIAQAMLGQPKLLIVDEPTVGLDPKERIAFRNLLQNYGEDRIILLSTHIVPDVSSTCDKLLILKEGRCLYQGAIDDMIRTVEGKVWLADVGKRQLEQLSQQARITSIVRKEGRIQARLLCNRPPDCCTEVTPETANLEDAYLYISDPEES